MLRDLNATAYIVEPGANALFFANVSTSHWRLSERPLLLVAQGSAHLSVLTPRFEITRAKMLPIPSDVIRFVSWGEEANPYEILASSLPRTEGNIFVDGHTRTFIVEGLRRAFPRANILEAPTEIRLLREQKSRSELDLLRCANEVGSEKFHLDLLNAPRSLY